MTPEQYTFQRITRCVDIVRYWPFFVTGFAFTSRFLHYPYTLETYRRVILKLVKTPTAYVGIVFDSSGDPVCFGAAYESTPVLFASQREYDIPFLYHQPTKVEATEVLRVEFERFCRQRGVKRYSMTSASFGKSTQECYGRYGLSRSYITYKREL